MCPDNVLKKHKRKSQPLDLDRRQQICPFCTAELVVAMATTAAHIGGSGRGAGPEHRSHLVSRSYRVLYFLPADSVP
jgi:hypothetical protein